VKIWVAALLVMLALVVVTAGGSSTTAAAECNWQRHSKRVVKHVRRHGRLRRVVHQRSWWTCEAIAAPASGPTATPAPAPTPPSAPAPAVTQEPDPEANRLAVKAHEYYYVLSRPKVKAGELTVELNNQGEDAHNLNIEREGDSGEPLKVAETASLQHNVASFDLPPGTYRLWCSLPEHDEKGMHATLVVE
jgi:plastocyanin